MKNKYLIIIFLTLIALVITGCTNKYGIDTSKYSTDGLKVVNCSRNATTDDGSKAKITYKAYYDKKE